MKRFLLGTWVLSISLVAQADGIQLEMGRYKGSVLVFTLTSKQKQVIDHFRTCHLEHFQTMNVYTPYVFTLTPAQERSLKATKGFSPRQFVVYETYRGYNDAGPHWNLALRFSKDQIEIPLNLVIPDSEAMKAHEVQGWKSKNPCFPELENRVSSRSSRRTDSP